MFYQNINENNEKILKIILILIGAGMIVCVFLMIFFVNSEIKKLENIPVDFKRKTEKEVSKKIIFPKITYSLSGLLEEINEKEKYIVFKAEIPSLEKDSQIIYHKEKRKALVDNNTKITKIVLITDENNKKTSQEISLSFKDLKIKEYIEVISNKDISDTFEFPAVQIRVLPH